MWLRHNLNQSVWFIVNSSPPSAAYMRQWIGSALVQIMVCRLFGTEPLSKPKLLSIGPSGTKFREILIKIQNFSFPKMHLKISSAIWRPFLRNETQSVSDSATWIKMWSLIKFRCSQWWKCCRNNNSSVLVYFRLVALAPVGYAGWRTGACFSEAWLTEQTTIDEAQRGTIVIFPGPIAVLINKSISKSNLAPLLFLLLPGSVMKRRSVLLHRVRPRYFLYLINSSKPEQNGHHFAGDIFGRKLFYFHP